MLLLFDSLLDLVLILVPSYSWDLISPRSFLLGASFSLEHSLLGESLSLEHLSPWSIPLLGASLSLEHPSPWSIPLLGEFIRGAYLSLEHGSPMRPATFCTLELLPSF
ncbi:hypothetical protein BCR34DRAFT_558928 [Clohesyomyces aquaticus]|uniref:Secreted protein n=1 Tax=Clohesyomyces aquaticus TaxID=1231657 RepID=A0A1Y1ZYC3_9PLEO|nr:hypothetical protein BCR34DRAFT_558928 [Clohesyomyces aquaticus]